MTRAYIKHGKELNNRKCAFCSNVIANREVRQRYCSSQCGHEARKQAPRKTVLIDVQCAVCGESIQRTKSDLKKRTRFACSLKCQRVCAGHAGGDIGAKAGRKAKEKWYREQSAKRRKANEWIQACDREASVLTSRNEATAWERKCSSVSTMLRHREPVNHSEANSSAMSWLETCNQEVSALKAKTIRNRQSRWALKCETTARNLRARAERKQRRKSYLGCCKCSNLC